MEGEELRNDRVPLLLVPHSGGSAASFRTFVRELPKWIDPRPIELPGRGRRWREVEVTTAADAVATLASAADDLEEFAVLGESLGAYLAVGLASTVGRCSRVIAVSNSALATRRHFLPFPVGGLDDSEILRVAGQFGVLPAAVLADVELAVRSAEILRADFELSESVIATFQSLVIAAPIDIIVGTRDETIDDDLEQWQRSTTSAVSVRHVNGGHLLTTDAPKQLAEIVADVVRADRSSEVGGP